MLKLHKEGPIHCKYIIEDNTELQDKTILMVKRDIDAQWLAGDELKQDQFKFMYSVMKIIYDSALRDALLNEKKEVIENVLPALVAYEALLVIKRILDTKEAEAKKEKEKLERDGGASKRDKPVEEPIPVVVVEPVKTTASPAKKGAQVQVVEMKSEADLAKEAERAEIQKYGVSYNKECRLQSNKFNRDSGSGSNISMMRRKSNGSEGLRSFVALTLTCSKTSKTTFCFKDSRARS